MFYIVEQAGGQCLPCVVDIRYEDQISKAVEQAVERFGGIDILVNNAGAISLTGTLNTTMKKFVIYCVHKEYTTTYYVFYVPILVITHAWIIRTLYLL